MGLNFITDTAVIAGMRTAFTVVRGSGDGTHGKATVVVMDCHSYMDLTELTLLI